MKPKHLAWVGLAAVLVATQFTYRTTAQSQDVKAAYDRAENLTRRVQGTTYNFPETPTFIQGTSKLWYRKSVKGGNEFVLVDAAAKTKAPAFDHAKLATSLSTAANGQYTALTLPFTTFEFVDTQQAIQFTLNGAGAGAGRGAGRAGGGAPAAAAGQPTPIWRCTLSDYVCTRSTPPAGQAGAGRGQGRAGAGGGGRAGGAPGAPGAEVATRLSPDGKWEALIQNYNVYVRPAAP